MTGRARPSAALRDNVTELAGYHGIIRQTKAKRMKRYLLSISQRKTADPKPPVLLDFWAPWCGPCRMVSPVVDEIASERGDIKVGKVNVDEQPELAAQFGVMSIPTLVVMKNGKLANKTVGAKPKAQILAML